MRFTGLILLMCSFAWAADTLEPAAQLEIAKDAYSLSPARWDYLARTLATTDHPVVWTILWDWLYEKGKPELRGDVVYPDRATLAREILAEKLHQPILNKKKSQRYLAEHQELTEQEVDWTPLLKDALKQQDYGTVIAIGSLWDCRGLTAMQQARDGVQRTSQMWNTLGDNISRMTKGPRVRAMRICQTSR